MPDNYDLKYGIHVDKMNDSQWSFGVCLSHNEDETYLFINFYKWSISIGKIREWKDFECAEWTDDVELK